MTLAVLIWATLTAAALALACLGAAVTLAIIAPARAILAWCGLSFAHLTAEWWWGLTERKPQ